MRKFNIIIILVIFASCKNTTKKELAPEPLIIENEQPVFDSIKAQKYGADEYGMKQYVIAFLKKGPNRGLDSTTAYNLQMAHMENIGKMSDAGQLVLAGPFLGDGEIRGIYIFNVKTVEEAKALTETDPAIQAGSLIMELLPWHGSAALMGINNEHKRVAKTLF
jgi:uncharacterized protein YciI